MTSRERRALVLGVMTMGGLLLGVRGLPAAVRWGVEARVTVADRLATVRQVRAAVRAAPLIRDSLRQLLQDVVAMAPHLLEGRTGSDAAAALASWVATEAGRDDLRVRRLAAEPETVVGPLRMVLVRAELEGDVRGLVRFLRSVETGRPLLSVKEVDITALDPASPERSPEVLRVRLLVGGWYAPVVHE